MATLLNPFIRALDANGDAVSGAQLAVFEAGTTTPVTTYSDRALTTAQAQPLIANSAGEFAQSFVASGVYKIRVSNADGVTLYENDNVRIADRPDDPVFFESRAAVLADATTYAEGTQIIAINDGSNYFYVAAASGASDHDATNAGGQKFYYQRRFYETVSQLLASTEVIRGVGKIWVGGGFRYEEAVSGASDHHITTAGGVKLYVLPSDDGSANVLAFGAKGDGVADDTTAIQTAIDAKIGTVAIPAGDYRLTDTIRFLENSPSCKGVGKRYNAGITSILRFDHANDGVLVNGQSHIGTVMEDITFRRAAAHFSAGINVKFDGAGGPSNIVSATTMNRCYVEGGASGIWMRGLINGVFSNVVCQGQATAGIHFYGTGTSPASNIISFDSFNVYNVTGGSGILYEGTDCGRNHNFSNGSIENCGRPIIMGTGDIAQNIIYDNVWFELNANPSQIRGGRRIEFRNLRNAQNNVDLIDPATFGATDVIFDGVLGAGVNALLGVPGVSTSNLERTTRAGSMTVSSYNRSSYRGSSIEQATSANQVAGSATLSTVRQSGAFLKNFLENWNIGGAAQWIKPSGVTAAADPLGGTEAWSINANQTITGFRQNTIPDNAVGVQMQYAVWAKGTGSIDLYNRGDGFAKRMEFQIDTPEWTRLMLRYVTEDATNDRALGFYMVCEVASAGSLSIWRPGIYAGFSCIDGRPVGASGGFEGGQPVAYTSGERIGRNLAVYGTAAPASETWMVGDKVINTAPSAGGNAGWVCTTAGTPGTWKTYGVIAS